MHLKREIKYTLLAIKHFLFPTKWDMKKNELYYRQKEEGKDYVWL